jgi:hypothetical protein
VALTGSPIASGQGRGRRNGYDRGIQDLRKYDDHQNRRKDACSATRVYRLKPGQRVFETATPINHIPEISSEIHVEDMNCSITAIR